MGTHRLLGLHVAGVIRGGALFGGRGVGGGELRGEFDG
jgi:hypothetical protein